MQGGPRDALRELLVCTLREDSPCNAQVDFRNELYANTVGVINSSIRDDKIAPRADAFANFQQQGRRKSRMDEDYLSKRVYVDVSIGKQVSGRTALRSDDHCTPMTASRYEEREMSVYQRACWRVCQSIDIVCNVGDAARLGDPPEETRLAAMWIAEKDVSVVPPPTVHGEIHRVAQRKPNRTSMIRHSER